MGALTFSENKNYLFWRVMLTDSFTFQRRWTGRRSPAGWAGNWVAGRWIRAELQSVARKTKSSVMFLIPESDERESSRDHNKAANHNNIHNKPLDWQQIVLWESTRLQFPPQSTLEAAHAVHDPGDVEEGQSDVLLVLTQQRKRLISLLGWRKILKTGALMKEK